MLRESLFGSVGVPPYLNYIPTPDDSKIFPPAKLREQLWRIPQGIVNVLRLDQVSKKNEKKRMKEDEMLDLLFPDNVITIANFKSDHFGTPLAQAFMNI